MLEPACQFPTFPEIQRPVLRARAWAFRLNSLERPCNSLPGNDQIQPKQIASAIARRVEFNIACFPVRPRTALSSRLN